MAEPGGVRSIAASIVGWVIVAIVVWFFFGWIFGALFVLLRLALLGVVVLGLLWVYFRLKGDGADDVP
jgi:hypothetical protein